MIRNARRNGQGGGVHDERILGAQVGYAIDGRLFVLELGRDELYRRFDDAGHDFYGQGYQPGNETGDAFICKRGAALFAASRSIFIVSEVGGVIPSSKYLRPRPVYLS